MEKSILEILVDRDGMTEEDAEELIELAREDLHERIDQGEQPDDICEEWFGLEPDYIEELIP